MDPRRRRKRRRLAVVLIAEIAFAISCMVLYNHIRKSAEAGTSARLALRGLQASIKPALLFADSEIPGKYYFGDGLGANCHLEIKANHRFSFTRTGCMGVYDQNQGLWEIIDGDVLVCKPEKPNKREGFEGMNTRFLPVKWGKRIYLVDENEMAGFCASASYRESNSWFARNEVHGNDYVKWNGKELPAAEGRPILPARYRTFYDSGAVESKVVRISPGGQVVLNNVSDGRIKPGMMLTIDAFENVELEVKSTILNGAIASQRYAWNSGRSVRVGDRFTTGSYWHRPHGTGFTMYSKLPVAKGYGFSLK